MSNNRYEVNPDLEEALMDLNDHMQKQLEKQEIDINDYDNVRYIVLKKAYENTIIFELYFLALLLIFFKYSRVCGILGSINMWHSSAIRIVLSFTSLLKKSQQYDIIL